jgi:hypothetical protein
MENALVIIDQLEPPAELAATLELAADFAREEGEIHAGGVRERLARIRVLVPRTGFGRVGRLASNVVCGFLADEATAEGKPAP